MAYSSWSQWLIHTRDKGTVDRTLTLHITTLVCPCSLHKVISVSNKDQCLPCILSKTLHHNVLQWLLSQCITNSFLQKVSVIFAGFHACTSILQILCNNWGPYFKILLYGPDYKENKKDIEAGFGCVASQSFHNTPQSSKPLYNRFNFKKSITSTWIILSEYNFTDNERKISLLSK